MRPILRGYLHQAAFYLSIAACIELLFHSQGVSALTANAVYSASLVGLYGISALYHSRHWGLEMYRLLKRIDHAAIFALIAGTATPICVLGIQGPLAGKLLAIIWSFAALGMIFSLFWLHSPKWLRAAFYVAIGWFALPYLSLIESSLGSENLRLLLIGGLIYTFGAIIYALKRPNFFPLVFGYHEIFHLFVVIASACHFYVIYNLS